MAAQIGAILLAGGASKRMGSANKLLMSIGGVPMVARVAATIAEAGMPLIVVLGHEADAVRAALAGQAAAFVHARAHALGMAHTLAAGIAAAPRSWDGALICLADMPWVGAELMGRLATAIEGPDGVAVPVHAGRRGNPVGWGHAWFPRLCALTGDTGGRAFLAVANIREIAADNGVLRDVDVPDDLAALVEPAQPR